MSIRILIVDDEPDLRLLVRMFLETSGFDVAEAETGELGLDAIEQQEPDLVLLDLRLPGIDAWGVLDVLRARGRLARLPVIMVSAQANVDTRLRAEKMGCRAFLSKPFDLDEFMSLITQVLGRGAA